MTLDALASGLVGALIGVGAAVLLQWQRDRLDGRAVARAVYMEIVANTLPLNLAMDSGVYAPLTDSTWLAALARLSRLLSPTELVAVAEFYHFVQAIRGRNYPVAGGANTSLQAVAQDAVRASIEASMVLEQRGWGPGEREGLHKARGPAAGGRQVPH